MASGLDLRKKALSGTAFTENAAEKKSSSSSSWDSSSKKSYGGASEKKWSPSVTAPSAVVQAAKSSGTNLKDVSTAAKTDKSVTPSTVSRAVSKKVFGTAAPITPTGALAASKKVFTPSTVSKPFLSVTKDIRKDITTLHSRIQEEANNYKKSPFKDVNTYLTDIKNKSGEGHSALVAKEMVKNKDLTQEEYDRLFGLYEAGINAPGRPTKPSVGARAAELGESAVKSIISMPEKGFARLGAQIGYASLPEKTKNAMTPEQRTAFKKGTREEFEEKLGVTKNRSLAEYNEKYKDWQEKRLNNLTSGAKEGYAAYVASKGYSDEYRKLLASDNVEHNMYWMKAVSDVNAADAEAKDFQKYADIGEQDENNLFKQIRKDIDNKRVDVKTGPSGAKNVWSNGQIRQDIINANDEFRYYVNMTEDEKSIYNYILGKRGSDAATEYYKSIIPTIDARIASMTYNYNVNFANKHKFAGAAANIGASIVQGAGYLNDVGTMVSDTLKGEHTRENPYSEAYAPTQIVQATTEGITKDMNPVGKALSEAALSAGQSAVNIPLGNIGLINMGLGAASQSAQSKQAAGASREQALAYATIAGAVEVATEKLPFEQVEKIFSKSVSKGTVKELFKTTLINMGTEGAEEAVSNVADNLADIWIFKDKSDYNLYVDELVKNGMTPDEAKRQAFKKFFGSDTALQALGGAISGGMMSAPAIGLGAVRSAADTYALGQDINSSNETAANTIAKGLVQGKDTSAYRSAEKLKNIVDSEGNKTPSNWQMGRQFQKNAAAVADEAQRAQMYGDRTGFNIRYRNNMADYSMGEASGNTVDINAKKSATIDTLDHEFGHAAQTLAPEEAQAAIDKTIEILQKPEYAQRLNKRLRELKAEYERNGIEITDSELLEDIAVDMRREGLLYKTTADYERATDGKKHFIPNAARSLNANVKSFFGAAVENRNAGITVSAADANRIRAVWEKADAAAARAAARNDNTVEGGKVKYSYVGTTEDGQKIYKTNYPANTPKYIKQNDLINLVQNVWSKNPITMTIQEGGVDKQIIVQFDPTLNDRSDLAKIVFGNKKGSGSEKRISLDLASDMYQIAEDAEYVRSKIETGKNSPTHTGVKVWHYFVTNIVYEAENGDRTQGHFNIDVKQKNDGNYFYSFAFEKGAAPQTLLAAVSEKTSPTTPLSDNSISDEGGKVKYSFAGTNAKTANVQALEKAQQMERQGADAGTIWRETGWGRGLDGKWRFEIDSSKAELAENPKLETHGTYQTGRLYDLFKYDELYEAYPKLKDCTVIIQDTLLEVKGAAFAERNEIVLSDKLFRRYTKEYRDYLNGERINEIKEIEQTPEYKEYNKYYDDPSYEDMDTEEWIEEEEKARDKFFSSELGKRYYELKWGMPKNIQKTEIGWSEDAKSVLVHEIQHLVQDIEGFATGSSDMYWARELENGYVSDRNADDLYENTAGEIEARDAEKRMNMPKNERRNNFPESMKPNDNVVFADGGVSYDIVTLDNGKEYVEATRQVIKGESIPEWRKSITAFFNDMLRGGSIDIKTTTGDILTITKKETAQKARDRYKYENGKKIEMTDSEFLVKLHAESHIDELSEISKPTRSGSDTKNHSFAKDGFTYRNVYFKDFDGSYYQITLSIGKDGGISTVYNVGKIKTDRMPTGKIISRKVGQSPTASLSVNNSIRENGGKVKKKFSLDAADEANTESKREAKALNKRYSSRADAEETATAIKKTAEQLQGGNDEAAKEIARAAAENIAAEMYVTDSSMSEGYEGLSKELRNTPISISDIDKSDIGDYNEFRKRYFGKLKLTNDGIRIDKFYQELAAEYPELFDASKETHPGDQLNRIAEVLDSLKPKKVLAQTRMSSGEYEKAIKNISDEIIEEARDISDPYKSRKRASALMKEYGIRGDENFFTDGIRQTAEAIAAGDKSSARLYSDFIAEKAIEGGFDAEKYIADKILDRSQRAVKSGDKLTKRQQGTVDYLNREFGNRLTNKDSYGLLDYVTNAIKDGRTDKAAERSAAIAETMLTRARFDAKKYLSDKVYAAAEKAVSSKKNAINSRNAAADLSTAECQKRFAENVDKAFSGELPQRAVITIGDTPGLLNKYGAGKVPITINQSTMYKIAYPTGYIGAEGQGHNLGIPALKQLPKQIANPTAILKSNSQNNSLVLLTEWKDTSGNPVIIPLHLNKDGAIGITNEIVSSYGKQNFDTLLTNKNGNSNILYTKNNKDIQQLVQSRLQLPGAPSDDTLVKKSISDKSGNVKNEANENVVPENQRDLEKAVYDNQQEAFNQYIESISEKERKRKEREQALEEEVHKRQREALEHDAASTPDDNLKRIKEEFGVSSVQDLMRNEIKEELDKKNPFVSPSKGAKAFRTFYRLLVDQNRPIYDYVRAAERQSGKKLYGKDNPYVLSTNALDAQNRAVQIVCEQMTDFDGNFVGESLFEVLKRNGINADNEDSFKRYLVAQHAAEWLDYDNHGAYKIVYGDKTLDRKDVQLAIARELELKYPNFKQAAEDIYDWERLFLKTWLVDNGIISEDEYNTLINMYPKYVPFFRDNGMLKVFKGNKKGFANQKSPIKTAEGGTAPILDPIENIMLNVASYVNVVSKNSVAQSLAKIYDAMPDQAKAIWEEVKPKETKDIQFEYATGEQMQIPDGDAERTLPDKRREVMDIKSSDIVTVLTKEGKRYFKVHNEEFFKAICDIKPVQVGKIMSAAMAFSRMRAAFITSFNPAFTLINNTVKDVQTMILNSDEVNKAKVLGGYAAAYVDIAKNSDAYEKILELSQKALGDRVQPAIDKTQEYDAYKAYLAMGGEYASMRSTGKNALKKTLRDAAEIGKPWYKKLNRVPGAVIGAYTGVADTIETAPRLQEFKRTLDKGYDYHQAYYNSKDITTNFSRHGTAGRYLNVASNFFNAAIQGVDKYFRQAKYNTKSFLSGTAALTMFELVSWACRSFLGDDDKDDDYANVSNYTKNNFYLFPIGGGKYISIPKGRESAVISTAIGAALDYLVSKNGERFKDFFGDYVLDQFMPDGSIIGFSTMLYLMRNEDYRGVPIVSEELQKLPEEQQYDDSTSDFAKWLGKTIKQSPKKIDFIINNDTGIVGKLNKSYGSVSGRADLTTTLTLGLNQTYTKDSLYSTDQLNIFYENADRAEKQKNGYPGANTQYLYNGFSQAKNVLTALNSEMKATDDEDYKRELRRLYVEFAKGNKQTPKALSNNVLDELRSLYKTDSEVMSLPSVKADIKAKVDGEEKSVTLKSEQIINYRDDLNAAISSAYSALFDSAEYKALSDNISKAEMVKDTKNYTVNKVKEFYVANGGEKRFVAESATQEDVKQDEYNEKLKKTAENVNTKLQGAAERFKEAWPDKDGYEVSDMQISEKSSIKHNGKEYKLSPVEQQRYKTKANEVYADVLEEWYNNEVNIEDVIGLTESGKYHKAGNAEGKQIELEGKMYNSDGTPRFSGDVEGKIIFQLKDYAQDKAAEEMYAEISGETAEEPTATPDLQASTEKHFVANKNYSAKSSGKKSASSKKGASRGTVNANASSASGKVSVPLTAFNNNTSANKTASRKVFTSQNKIFKPTAYASADTSKRFVPSASFKTKEMDKLKGLEQLKGLERA